jgi:hypothetical protein
MSSSRILQALRPKTTISDFVFLSLLGAVNAENKEENLPITLIYIPIGIALALCAYCLCSNQRRNRPPPLHQLETIRIAPIRSAGDEISASFYAAKRALETQEQIEPDLTFSDSITTRYSA